MCNFDAKAKGNVGSWVKQIVFANRLAKSTLHCKYQRWGQSFAQASFLKVTTTFTKIFIYT